MAKNVHQLKEKLYKYRYLEWTGGGDNGKECTSTEGKNCTNVDRDRTTGM